MLNFPKVEFTPHPAGQHQGDIFEVEVRLQEETPWGLKDKIILKIQSETPMLDEDGNQRTDQSGEPMFFNIWEFLTLTRKGKLGDRRAAILGRTLTNDDFGDGYDPEEEFLNRKVGYVIKHKPGKEQGTISASIETMWPIGKIPTTKEAPPAVAKDDDLPF
jgi:hypothetical protein|tara:strand:- start:887 stop:1369 length:483 start_codon:yes stop_codon:yes gene_type:complete